ncbi:MAG: hypothetical protein M3016_00390 [Actinomycetota bacterium]|nr:hypothetical protein [Actinomycetota bacterium]
MALRAMPRIGSSVLVKFLATSVRGTVKRVGDEGRRLEVATEDGESLVFALNRATATFTTEGQLTGARLVFED